MKLLAASPAAAVRTDADLVRESPLLDFAVNGGAAKSGGCRTVRIRKIFSGSGMSMILAIRRSSLCVCELCQCEPGHSVVQHKAQQRTARRYREHQRTDGTIGEGKEFFLKDRNLTDTVRQAHRQTLSRPQKRGPVPAVTDRHQNCRHPSKAGLDRPQKTRNPQASDRRRVVFSTCQQRCSSSPARRR